MTSVWTAVSHIQAISHKHGNKIILLTSSLLIHTTMSFPYSTHKVLINYRGLMSSLRFLGLTHTKTNNFIRVQYSTAEISYNQFYTHSTRQVPDRLHCNRKTKNEFKFAWYAMCMCKHCIILVTSDLKSSYKALQFRILAKMLIIAIIATSHIA